MGLVYLKRQYFTLMEIMIAMLLIAMVIGVLAYNWEGVFGEGKAFKTKFAISRVEEILNQKAHTDPSFLDDVPGKWENVVRGNRLVKNPESLLRDGWGERFEVYPDGEGNIKVTSKRYDRYLETHKDSMFKKESE